MSQLFEDGKVINVDGADLECTGVSYQENEAGERTNFSYTFRVKSELDAERKAEAEAKAEEERLAAEAAERLNDVPAEQASAPEPTNEPEQPKEETAYVK